MKIKKLKVSNFRNLKSIDIDFWNVNILTWKNSTWKTNLTQLLTNCLNTNDKAKDYFWDNIVTVWQGLNFTNIETTLTDITYMSQMLWWGSLRLYKPHELTYKYKIAKKTLSTKEHSLDYTGEELRMTEEEVEWKLGFLDYEDVINWKIKLKKVKEKNIYKKIFEEALNDTSNIWDSKIEYFDIFKNISKDKIVNYDNHSSFSACLWKIYDFIVKKYKSDKYKNIIDKLNVEEYKFTYQSFKEAEFIDLLSDIQRNKNIFKKYNEDLDYFTDWIIKKVEINTTWAKWFKGDIFVKTPSWPKDIEYLSSGSAILLYFITLKNWLKLSRKEASYTSPAIMIFDELDTAIHPSLIWKFSDLLKIISTNIQLFITSHSPNFIDKFKREDIYLLKDIWSFDSKVKVKSNILSYKTIMDQLNDKEKKIFEDTSSSELYIDGYIESIFPIIES